MIFILGIIIGLLLNPAKQKIVERIVVKYKQQTGNAQFLDPVTFKEKFEKSKNIGEVLDE